jgi:hypothetical protein
VVYQDTLTASGGTPPYTWSATNVLPQGLSVGASGSITGTPAYLGNFGIGVQVTDSGSPRQTATQMLSISIAPQVLFTTTSLPNAHANAPYDAIITVSTNIDQTSWKLTSGSLPTGMQLSNPGARQVEITGTVSQTGSYPFTLQVQDTSSPPQVATQNYTLTVDSALAVATLKLGSAVVGAGYSVTLSAVNGAPPYQWSAVGLPPGLVIDPNTGTISGVPSAWGTYQPTVTVTDSAAHSASQTLGLTVLTALTAPNYGPQTVTVNRSFSYNLIATGGSYPYTWSIVSGGLPPGLYFQPSQGLVYGTATQLGSSNVTFQVTDSGSPQQTSQLTTTFNVVPPQLYVTGTLPQNLPQNVPFQWTAGVQGGTPPYHWNPATGNLPPGLTFDQSTGDLSGTPSMLGQYTFVLSATDSGSPVQTANSTFTANVTVPLGRNDAIAHATPLGDGSWLASISPYADPPDSPSPVPDTDYYRIIGNGGSVVTVRTAAQNTFWNTPLDTVIEIVDANGSRLNVCRQPGDTSNNFNSACMNDDIVKGVNRDSQLDILVPGQSSVQTTFFVHVLDWRGDARPDMQYYLNVTGSVAPLKVSAPAAVTYGSGYSVPAACPTGLNCSAPFTSTGGTAPLTWKLDSGNIPAGMALDPATGLLSGTPTTSGAYTMVVRATDSASPSQTTTASFTLTIEVAPQITTTSLPDGQSGVPYNYTIPVTGGVPPYTWGLTAYWEAALSFDLHTGTISGTPARTGTDDLYVSVGDFFGLGDFKHLQLNVKAGPFSWQGGTYPGAKVGQTYYGAAPPPVGGTWPFTFTLMSGLVPPGLSLSSDGSLNGTPTAAGTYTFTLSVIDSSAVPQSATASVSITVVP